MPDTADIVVVGLGAVGSAAAYQSAKAGARVIGIDRFRPPHDRGSSHGETRITRQAIGEGRDFVPLVLRSDQIWNEIEAESGRNLVTRNGVLILASPGMRGSHHGSASFLQDTIDIAREFQIPHEVLSHDEIRRRYPQFRIEDGEAAYFEPGAGFIRPELCVETQLQLAARHGATLRTGEAVTAIRPLANCVDVSTDKSTYSAAKVILTAGPWICEFLRLHLKQYFRVYRQVMHWFELEANYESYTPARFPVFIWLTGAGAHDMMYGFPAVDGPAGGIKVATERYEATVHPDGVPRQVTALESQELYHRYIEARLPDVSSNCLRAATCLYTVTPDARFVIDHALGSELVLFASACSGHGFKHSAALGEVLANLVTGASPEVDLAPFRLDRLAKKDPSSAAGVRR